MKRQRLWRALAAAVLAGLPCGAQAASITVDGINCLLGDAITAANTDTAAGNCPAGSGADTITLGVDVTLDAALPPITTVITIEGANHFISGNNNDIVDSVLVVASTGTLKVNRATVKEGNALIGGGINNEGTVTLTNCTVSGNSAPISGGGINNSGTVTLTNSTVSGNFASGGGGGGIRNSGTVTLTNSTVSGHPSGGGIRNDSGTLTLTNSTVSGNFASGGGGGGFATAARSR